MPHQVAQDRGVNGASAHQIHKVSDREAFPGTLGDDEHLRLPTKMPHVADIGMMEPVRRSAGYSLFPNTSPTLSPSHDIGLKRDDKVSRLSKEALDGSDSDTLGRNSKLSRGSANRSGAGYTLKSEGMDILPTNGCGLGSTSKSESMELLSTNGSILESEDRHALNGGSSIMDTEQVLKLSPGKLSELTSSPNAFPLQVLNAAQESPIAPATIHSPRKVNHVPYGTMSEHQNPRENGTKLSGRKRSGSAAAFPSPRIVPLQNSPLVSSPTPPSFGARPPYSSRAASTPFFDRSQSSNKVLSASQSSLSQVRSNKSVPAPLDFEITKPLPKYQKLEECLPSPMPASIPIPSFSLPGYLQLELSLGRPSSHYLHRSATSDLPYESSRVMIDRLLNFLFLPPLLEQVLWFGALACLDAWLYTFTILPLRFLIAVSILVSSWGHNLVTEVRFVLGFVYWGLGRLWKRGFSISPFHFKAPVTTPRFKMAAETLTPAQAHIPKFQSSSQAQTTPANEDPYASYSRSESSRKGYQMRHRRSKSKPSALLPSHKADILNGLLIIISCTILMYFDASMMYHSIRGQAAVKLYVIYNVLEVCDRLLSALGQDVLECLFSIESLERKPDGRSKVLRPSWLFLLALLYNLLHSTALFYQVITLNVAVNSYSNALLTLLISNQFVEIKSTVFKKFEKENLFQVTCADVVERFQLWLMLIIIASRNIIETNSLGGLVTGSGSPSPSSTLPVRGSSIIPTSFTVLPDWLGQVLTPYLLVLGTEMLVDWLKHAYITKFNNVKPNIYGRFLDILAKDYYSHAFTNQNLTRRLGLPVIPLSCLFIRASVQTYHMFLASSSSSVLDFSPATALSTSSSAYTSATTAATLSHIDSLFRNPSSFTTLSIPTLSIPTLSIPALPAWLPLKLLTPYLSYLTHYLTSSILTTLTFFLLAFLLLLTLKLVLGMVLLSYARTRYEGMKVREQQSSQANGKRIGGWGAVEVGEERRRWIYEDDAEGLRVAREREEQGKEKVEQKGRGDGEKKREKEKGRGLEAVRRYSMVAKRIW